MCRLIGLTFTFITVLVIISISLFLLFATASTVGIVMIAFSATDAGFLASVFFFDFHLAKNSTLFL